MGKLRGHAVEFKDGEWVFSDTGEDTITHWKARPCGHCGLYNTKEDHDGCLKTLPRVMNACCGHGDVGGAYIQFNDKSIIREEHALKWFKEALI